MDKLLTGVLTAPIATVFIISGIIFLFIAVIGNISGKIEPSVKSRIASGILGLIFIFMGLIIHLNQDEPQTPKVTSTDQTKPEYSKKVTPIKASSGVTKTKKSDIVISATAEEESGDNITGAKFISVGTSIRGNIATEKDRDFYKFEALSDKTRVILRKLSRGGFHAYLDIYDAVENKIKSENAGDDISVTLAFKSEVGSVFFIVIKSYPYGYENGDYELVVKIEE